MKVEFLDALSQCELLARKLLSGMDADIRDMEKCVQGEILTTYRRGMETAQVEAQEILREIVGLQSGG